MLASSTVWHQVRMHQQHACAETSTEVSELVSDSTDEDADMLIRLSISKNNGHH